MGAAASMTEITDGEGLRAGAAQVQFLIDRNGQITTEQCGQIIEKYLNISSKARQYFPSARTGSWVLKNSVRVLKDYGMNAENTLYAQSLCPDEINHELGDISTLFSSFLGEVFHMGGLAGIPFTGKTGFGAFSQHVPDGGNLFVLMAPHIGISDRCALGHYSRDGQSTDGAACGASVGAYGHCCSGKAIPDSEEDPADYQMNFIIAEINKRMEKIKEKGDNSDAIQAELCMQTYDIGKTMLDQVCSTSFGNGKGCLVVLTGVQINMPRPFEDYFCPLSFELHKKDQEPVDLMAKSFGWGATD
jgi:hypothetical protein